MGDISIPMMADNDERRRILIEHLVLDHGATRADIGAAADSAEMLLSLHESWAPDPVFEARESGSEVALTVTEGDTSDTWHLTPAESLALGLSLIKAAGVTFAQRRLSL